MPREKFKLSDTVKFLTRQLNAVVGGGEVTLELEVETPRVEAGGEVMARAVLRNPDEARQLDALVLGMSGQVQREGGWREYTESVEVGQGTQIAQGQELVVPIVIYIPEDAVLSEDGAEWQLEARAVLDKLIDPLAEASFEVIATSEERRRQLAEEE